MRVQYVLKYMRVNKKEAMCGRSCINVKVEPFSTKLNARYYWQRSSFVVTKNLNRLIAYDEDTCGAYTPVSYTHLTLPTSDLV